MPEANKSFRHRALVEGLATPKPRVTIDELPVPYSEPGKTDALNGNVTKQEEIFLRHWATHYGTPGQSAIHAGYPSPNAAAKAHTLLAQSRIQRRLAEIERELMTNVSIDAESLFREVVITNLKLARARPPVQVWNPPCRYCYGDNHEYQRTHAEFEADFTAHITRPVRVTKHGKPLPIRVPLFDPKGGPGYDVRLPPHPDCPECHGDGDTKHPIVRFKDTRFYTAEERELFAGAKSTKDGVELMWKDQAQARNFLNDLALRMTEYRRPEDAIDITEMSPDRLRQFLEYAKEQGFDVDPEALEDVE